MERPTTRAVLLLACPDRPGIVASVATWIAETGGNIVDAGQYRDSEHDLFLQRVELDHPRGGEWLRSSFEDIADRWAMRWSLHTPDRPARLVVLTSREAHCLYDLASRCATGDLHAEIALVASNHPDHADVAKRFEIPFAHVPVVGDGPEAREDHEQILRALIEASAPDLVVLARYMRILSPALCDALAGSAINIHHSFLPAFTGARAYHQAWERGVKLIGATAHYVTAKLDEGPIIAQDVARISHADSPSTMARRGRDLEALVLAEAVRAHLEHRVIAYENRTVVFE